jgi:hypothetical protein
MSEQGALSGGGCADSQAFLDLADECGDWNLGSDRKASPCPSSVQSVERALLAQSGAGRVLCLAEVYGRGWLHGVTLSCCG